MHFRTLCDVIRHGVTRMGSADLYFGHGTTSAFDEAVFLALEHLHILPENLESFWHARLLPQEIDAILSLFEQRISTRKPAPYLVNRAYIKGMPFYVDERVIVPRSFLGEILLEQDSFTLAGDPEDITHVLDLCTGSGALAIIAARAFPLAQIDAVDISPDALAVARRNVDDYGLQDRITLFEGDLFAPLSGRTYDLIITNPPYVDAAGMADLPEEYQKEPALALAAGSDGLDIIRTILDEGHIYLNPQAGILCEIGRTQSALQAAYPHTGFDWLDTEHSSGEVFYVSRKNLISSGENSKRRIA